LGGGRTDDCRRLGPVARHHGGRSARRAQGQTRETAMPSTGTTTGPPAPRASRSWLLRRVRGLLTGLRFLGRLLLLTWATLAIYFANLPWAWSRLALAVVFAAFSVWALWLTRRRRMGWVFLGLFAAVVVWEVSIPPSHDRPWRAEVAVLPRAVIDGDRVRITGVRDFD